MERYAQLEKQMANAVHELHRFADELVNELEGNTIIADDSAEGDNARNALANAYAWRARMECGA
jgi:hypothetical protein